jgi:hypothetical protein
MSACSHPNASISFFEVGRNPVFAILLLKALCLNAAE